MIIREMLEADGVIFASPTYSHMISATMKNFFDRFGFYAHRPHFFDKCALSLTTCSGYGAEFTTQYMDKMVGVFGFNVVPPLNLHVRPGKVKEADRQTNLKKTLDAVNVLIARINKGERTKPSLSFLVPFHIFKLVSELESDFMKADYEYYKDKKDYYFDVKINPVKSFLARKIARKTILN